MSPFEASVGHRQEQRLKRVERRGPDPWRVVGRRRPPDADRLAFASHHGQPRPLQVPAEFHDHPGLANAALPFEGK